MRDNLKPIAAAFVTLGALYLAGVLLFYGQIAERGVSTAGASAVLLLVSWTATAWVYGRLKPGSSVGNGPLAVSNANPSKS